MCVFAALWTLTAANACIIFMRPEGCVVGGEKAISCKRKYKYMYVYIYINVYFCLLCKCELCVYIKKIKIKTVRERDRISTKR